MIKLRKIGGIHFLRIGRVQFSWCVVKRKFKSTPTLPHIRDYPLVLP